MKKLEIISEKQTSLRFCEMNLIGTLFLLLITFSPANGQQKTVVSPHYVFPDFFTGSVLLKSGNQNDIRLNYNTITEEMIFENQGKYLAISNLESIDTVYILNRKFIPVEKKFYEILVNMDIPLFVRYLSSVTPPGKPTAYGGTSQTSSSTSVNKLYLSGNTYDMELPDDYKVTTSEIFFIFHKGQYNRINSVNQLIKLIPEKKTQIKEFVKENKTDFKKQEDLITLIRYCNK
jgi:hypothetical protein